MNAKRPTETCGAVAQMGRRKVHARHKICRQERWLGKLTQFCKTNRKGVQ